jgi:hypothetical protein
VVADGCLTPLDRRNNDSINILQHLTLSKYIIVSRSSSDIPRSNDKEHGGRYTKACRAIPEESYER